MTNITDKILTEFDKAHKKINPQLNQMEMKKPIKLDQEIINAYEGFVKNVYEAIRFTEMGSGKAHTGVFAILVPIINAYAKEMWKKIEEAMSKEPDLHKNFKD
jgi:hypothetical protein